jgi:hypothetical protein
LEELLLTLKQNIQDSLLQELKNKIHLIEKEIELLENQCLNLTKNKVMLEERLSRILTEKEISFEQEKREIEKEKKAQKFKAMKKHKGQYSFTWKRERKSWQAAYCHVYFDIGEDYILKRVGSGFFQKILITEFLQEHLQSNKTNKIA